MNNHTCTFQYLGSVHNRDGTVSNYILEVTDTRDERVEVISVEAKHLSSAQSMKRILLGRNMFYSVTQKKHDRLLIEMFDPQPEAIQE